MPERKDYVDRLRKLEHMRSVGIDPYPHYFHVSQDISDIVKRENDFLGKEVSTAGRLMALRYHGKVGFGDLVMDGYKIQIFLRYDVLGDKYSNFKDIVDKGDFIGVKGDVVRTEKGELSILLKDFAIISKSLYDLPHQWFGIEDVETRYRQRYLDMILNPEIFEIFRKRSYITREIRNFLNSKGFIEFETPILQPVYGGANAKPFITYVNAIERNYYLRISDELYLKRLLVAGYPRVYEIGKDFRNEDIDSRHNPEFTMIEIYEAFKDYKYMMDLTENLIKHVAETVNGTLKISLNGREVDLSKPWKRVRMLDLLYENGIDAKRIGDDDIKELLKKYEIKMPAYVRGIAITKLFEAMFEESFIEPVFVMDYPRESTPLCKLHRDDPSLVERFELYINGIEIANGYSELNDPLLQERFFREEMERRTLGDEEAQQMDMDFIEALRTGMPNAGGVGIGIDRLSMILTGAKSIKEVIYYPILAPKQEK
ncbi:MAG: lysine--tRNA ligase [Thermoplasmata archaeon]|jgi:lysyl-tRNA synthetase class 2|nr:lysine--tRNA ligase [Thermoplasmata archaeon]MVT13867.1 lysine--tRNA ligase [Euryarchaeota archaeon]MVT14086.1 lysine--tRNA ligase [Euryarchaeota archaeon]MVT35753.1 lysine--tRNA ligase [Euryarchaeota archaeon]